jgi:TonB family protein
MPAPAGLPSFEISIGSEAIAPTDEATPDSTGTPVRVSAGATTAHPDTGEPGRGGQPAAAAAALNLAAADEHMRLSTDLLSRLDRDQIQRIRVGRTRVSWEDRRSTTHPAELTFVAMGAAPARERRPLARRDPSRGAMESPPQSCTGSAGGDARDPGDVPSALGAHRAGGATDAPGLGLPEARPGQDHRSATREGRARPAVVLAPVAIPATQPGLAADNVDSEQEVAATLRSLVHASTAGGIVADGAGGAQGGGPSAAGGAEGSAFASRPLGLGDFDVVDYWTPDPRLLSYFRRMHALIDPLWADAFPKRALYDLKQGTVILEFTVQADGRVVVSWPPLRPSGVDEFDTHCADAVRRAAPFGPIPPELGVTSIRVRAPFVAKNPIVH